MHLLHVACKRCHHVLVLLGNLCSDGITLQQPLKAFQQLERAAEGGAVIKRLYHCGKQQSRRRQALAGNQGRGKPYLYNLQDFSMHVKPTTNNS